MMLPIKTVILFKHGVGFFEREGQVSGNTSIDLYFRASEMNDVLKSLTVLDLNDGIITNISISYETTLPIEEQLKDMEIDLPENNTYSGLLSQVQGAQVAVEMSHRDGASKKITGTVTGIETVKRQVKYRDTSDVIFDSTHILLLVEGGALQTFDIMEAKQIILLDEKLKKDLQHLLDVLIMAKKKDLKKLTIFLRGEAERTINISYIVAAPIWKTSYRLLLDDNLTYRDTSIIQGWALVDNIQDEDWENVSLSLVAGLPVSFIHDLYSPRYQKRPEVLHRDESEEAVASLGDEAFEQDTVELEDTPVSAYAPLLYRETYLKQDSKSKSVFSARQKRSVPVQTGSILYKKAHQKEVLFQYDIENPVTVRRQQSALVPFLQTALRYRDTYDKRVAVYNPEVSDTNPISAVLFKNTTGLTLESGPITLFENDAYVGEAMLNTLEPDEEQLLSYNVELGCVININHRSDEQEVHQVCITQGSLYLYYYDLEYKTYIINNTTDKKIDLFIEHRFKPGWELVDTPPPVERTARFYRFRVEVPSKRTRQFTVTEYIERSRTHAIEETSRDTLSLWLDNKYIDKKTGRILEGIVQLTEQISQLQHDIQAAQETIAAIFKNQKRVRQNLQVLLPKEGEVIKNHSDGQRALRDRYIAILADEEDKLLQYQTDINNFKAQKEAAEKKLNTQLNAIEFKAK